jgi:DNA-binding NarL/FixJ family response regulator
VNPSPVVKAKKKVFIVDDHAILRDGLSELLNHTEDLIVCGEAASAEEALERIPAASPDLAVVDLSLPGMSGMDLVSSLNAKHPSVKILVLSMHDESIYAEKAVRAGARGYIMKHQVAREVAAAIRTVLSGDLYLSQKLSKELLEAALHSNTRPGDSPADRLSERELEVFRMIGKGKGATEIARTLRLNVKTIETYQARMKEKLGAKDSAQLYQQAVLWLQKNEL